jgi:O-antigen ligase
MNKNIESWWIRRRELFIERLIQASILAFIIGVNGLANVFLIALLPVWLIQRGLKQQLFSTLKNPYFWCLSALFFLTLTGVIWSEDQSSAWKYVEMRLLLLLLPLILTTTKLTGERMNRIFLTWVMAVVAGFLLGLSNSYLIFLESHDSGYFYNDNLVSVVNKQAPYYGLFVNFALILCVYLFLSASRKWRWVFISLAFLLLVCQILLAVRIALLTTILLIFFSVIIYGVRKSSRQALGLVAIALAGLTIATMLFPQMTNRFRSMTSNFSYTFDNPNPVNHFNAPVNQANWNGLTLRLALWHCGIDAARENPLKGTGTGDYDEAMERQFDQKNFLYAKEMNFGVHNQYLYTIISFGITGFIIWFLSFIFPLIASWKAHNYLYIAFVGLLAIAFMTENILNRYYGIYFVAVFSSLLFFQMSHKKEN